TQLEEHAVHRLEIAPPLDRELERGIQAAKQRHTEVRFQRLDLPADRRWREMQLRSRVLEAEPLGGARKGAQEGDRRQIFGHHRRTTPTRYRANRCRFKSSVQRPRRAALALR